MLSPKEVLKVVDVIAEDLFTCLMNHAARFYKYNNCFPGVDYDKMQDALQYYQDMANLLSTAMREGKCSLTQRQG